MIQNLEDERDHYKDECQILQDMVKKRIVSKTTIKSPPKKGKVFPYSINTSCAINSVCKKESLGKQTSLFAPS